MREVSGKPLLEHLLNRVRQVKHLDGIIVATSDTEENDVIEKFCSSYGVPCFRGSEDDVLARMLGALESQMADIGVEVYGDSPLSDPKLINECIEVYLGDDSYDLVGNDMKATYPSGMYSETFSVKALQDSAARCQDPAIREHGTMYLRQHPELYKLKNIEAKGRLRRPDIYLDVDTEVDVRVIEAILNHFAPRNDFSLEEIFVFLDEHSELAQLNQHVHRRWKQYQYD